MTERSDGNAPERGNWLLLGTATLLLAGALGFAMTRSDLSGDGPQAVNESAPSASGMAQLETTTRESPGNATAWAALGQARFEAGNFSSAAQAYRRAVELEPRNAAYWSATGEAEVLASRVEPMPASALAAFRRAHALDRTDPRARYFLAVKRDIDGDHAGAINDWLALLADTPRGAPWESDLRRTIEQVGQMRGIDVDARLAAVRQPEVAAADLPTVARAIPGPSREQMEAAAALPKGQQDQMVAGMVERLENRLRENPQQPDRWLMLMRSRMTLGEPDQAAAALRRAIAANPANAERLRAEARLLGVPGA
jgi:cytochrome c-type biogenesis protein CcmH